MNNKLLDFLAINIHPHSATSNYICGIISEKDIEDDINSIAHALHHDFEVLIYDEAIIFDDFVKKLYQLLKDGKIIFINIKKGNLDTYFINLINMIRTDNSFSYLGKNFLEELRIDSIPKTSQVFLILNQNSAEKLKDGILSIVDSYLILP